MPAALTAWSVTAAEISWGIGAVIAVICAVAGTGWWLSWWWLRWRGRDAAPAALRAVGAGVLGVTVIGAGFGIATGLRSTPWITIRPSDCSARRPR